MSDPEFQHKVLTQLGEINGSLEMFQKAVDKRLDAVHRTLHGNGVPGLAGEVAVLKNQVGELRGTESNARTAKVSAKTSLGAALVAAGMGLLAAINNYLTSGK